MLRYRTCSSVGSDDGLEGSFRLNAMAPPSRPLAEAGPRIVRRSTRHTRGGPGPPASRVAGRLLDDLRGLLEHRWGDRQPQSLGRPEVDHEVEHRWLLDRQVRRTGPFEDLVDVGGSTV